MFEMTIAYWPKTRNVVMDIITGEPFEFDECDIHDIITPTAHAMIHSPEPELYPF